MTWAELSLWVWVLFISEWAIWLVMLAVVPFRRTPAAAMGWPLLNFFKPWGGLVFYLLIVRANRPLDSIFLSINSIGLVLRMCCSTKAFLPARTRPGLFTFEDR